MSVLMSQYKHFCTTETYCKEASSVIITVLQSSFFTAITKINNPTEILFLCRFFIYFLIPGKVSATKG